MIDENVTTDIDEVLADFNSQIIVFHNEIYGTNLSRESFYTYNFHEVWGGAPEEARRKVREFYETEYYRKIVPIPGAQEAMSILKKRGHKLFAVTGRSSSLAEKTEKWISEYFPNIFSEICFANTFSSNGGKRAKSEICKKLNSRLIIEDDLMHIHDCAQANMQVLVFDTPWNRVSLPKGAIRIFDWVHIVDVVK